MIIKVEEIYIDVADDQFLLFLFCLFFDIFWKHMKNKKARKNQKGETRKRKVGVMKTNQRETVD